MKIIAISCLLITFAHCAKLTPKPIAVKTKTTTNTTTTTTAATATVIAKSSPTKPEYRFEDDAKSGVTLEPKNNVGKIITVVSDFDGLQKQCQCIIFHLCPAEDVFTDLVTNKSLDCGSDIRVCCAISHNETLPDSAYDTATEYGSAVSEKIDNSCICVPENKCTTDPSLAIYGGDYIQTGFKNTFCNSHETCCLPQNILSASQDNDGFSSGHHGPDETKPYAPSDSGTHGLPENGGFSNVHGEHQESCTKSPSQSTSAGESRKPTDSSYQVTKEPSTDCTCVPFHKCHNRSLEHYGAGSLLFKNEFKCESDQICCPYDDVISEHQQSSSSNGGHDLSYPTKEPSNPTYMGETHQYESSHQVPKESFSECSCVLFHKCHNRSLEDHGAGSLLYKNQFKCENDKICCPYDDILSEHKHSSSETDSSVKPNHAECGIRMGEEVLMNRVTGDDSLTYFGEFPWMILLLKKENPEHVVCGASLLSARIVLTAAHCVKKINKDSLIVRAGEHNTYVASEYEPKPHQDRYVSEINIHPHFHPVVGFNDLAFLVVDKPFKFRSNVAPICLPLINSSYATSEPENYYEVKHCLAIGWGKNAYDHNATFQNVLRKVDLKLVRNDKCQESLRKLPQLGLKFILHSSFICAVGKEGKDTCQGDGGGPLFCPLKSDPKRYVQVGITSWGIGCGNDYPSVYASLLYSNAKWVSTEFQFYKSFDRVFTADIREEKKTDLSLVKEKDKQFKN